MEHSPIQDYAMTSKHLHAVLESKEGILVLCITCLASTGLALLHLPSPAAEPSRAAIFIPLVQPVFLPPNALQESFPQPCWDVQSDTRRQLRNEWLVVMTTQTTMLSPGGTHGSQREASQAPSNLYHTREGQSGFRMRKIPSAHTATAH